MFIHTAWVIKFFMISIPVTLVGLKMCYDLPETRVYCLKWLESIFFAEQLVCHVFSANWTIEMNTYQLVNGKLLITVDLHC